MNTFFLISFIIFGVLFLGTFIYAFKKIDRVLIFVVPLLIGSLCVLSATYSTMFGYGVEGEWEELPDEISIVFFETRYDSISVWVKSGSKDRLYHLPRNSGAEAMFEKHRKSMGEGKHLNLKRSEEGQQSSGDQEGQQGEEENNGEGNEDSVGFNYKVESIGNVSETGSLPRKDK